MTFTPEQVSLLQAPLVRSNVKTREGGRGRQLSFIEGWHAIAEANRLFGFDGWTRTTDSLNLVADYEGKTKYGPAWFVTYTSTVTITVDGIVRTGTGAGHGMDKDRGQSHESAIKEAETDATKRALMTFGNQFGLALYDKEQREVADKAPTPTPKLVVLKETPTDTHPQEVTPKKEESVLTTEDRETTLALLMEWKDTDPLVFKRFLNEFRAKFGLTAKDKVNEHINEVQHKEFCEQFFVTAQAS